MYIQIIILTGRHTSYDTNTLSAYPYRPSCSNRQVEPGSNVSLAQQPLWMSFPTCFTPQLIIIFYKNIQPLCATKKELTVLMIINYLHCLDSFIL